MSTQRTKSEVMVNLYLGFCSGHDHGQSHGLVLWTARGVPGELLRHHGHDGRGTLRADLGAVHGCVFSQLGWALFGVSVVVCCFEFGLEYSTGRGNIQQTALNILKGFLAVSLFSTVPVRLYALSVSLQASFTAGITGLGDIGALGQNLIAKLTTRMGSSPPGWISLLDGRPSTPS